jgi:gliding motility-associated-like protein
MKAESKSLAKSAFSPVSVTGVVESITGINVFCEGENSTTTLTVHVTPSLTSPHTFAWNIGSTANSITVTVGINTTYSVTVWGLNSIGEDTILGTASKSVYLTERPTAIRVNDTLCPGQDREVTLGMRHTTARYFVWSWDTVANGLPGPENHWDPPPTTDSINFWIPPLVSRTALNVKMSTHPILEFGYENSCYSWDSAFIELIDTRFQTSRDTSACEGQFVNLSVSRTRPDSEILWIFEGDTIERNVTSITVEIPEHGDFFYQVIAEDTNRCRAEKTIRVRGWPVPKNVHIVPEEEVVCRGASTILTAAGENCESFFWTNTRETTESIEIWPRQAFTYSVVAYGGPNRTGCHTGANIMVSVMNCDVIYFPTAIRLSSQIPENRIFKPVGVPNDFSRYYFAIFNRWGQLIFESNNFEIGWNGTHQGENVRPGTYVYKFQLTNRHDVWERMGTVTVLD